MSSTLFRATPRVSLALPGLRLLASAWGRRRSWGHVYIKEGGTLRRVRDGGRPAGPRRAREIWGPPGRGVRKWPKIALSAVLAGYFQNRGEISQNPGARGGLLRNDFFGVILTRNLGEFWHRIWGNFGTNFGGILAQFWGTFLGFRIRVQNFIIKISIRLGILYINFIINLYCGEFIYKILW